MSTVVWQQNQRRRPPMPALCAHMREIFDDHKDLNVAEMIEELDTYEFNPAELKWIVDNKKGKVLAWAKKELADIKQLEDLKINP